MVVNHVITTKTRSVNVVNHVITTKTRSVNVVNHAITTKTLSVNVVNHAITTKILSVNVVNHAITSDGADNLDVLHEGHVTLVHADFLTRLFDGGVRMRPYATASGQRHAGRMRLLAGTAG